MNTLPALLAIASSTRRGVWLPLALIALFDDDYPTAVIVSQLAFWQSVTTQPEGWVVKTYVEWYDETRLSKRIVSRVVESLRTQHLIETKVARSPYHGHQPVVHYRLDEAAIERKWATAAPIFSAVLRSGSRSEQSESDEKSLSGSDEKSLSDGDDSSLSYTSKRNQKTTSQTDVAVTDPYSVVFAKMIPLIDVKLGGLTFNAQTREEMNELREYPVEYLEPAFEIALQQELRKPRAILTYVRRICENWKTEGRGVSGLLTDEQLEERARQQFAAFQTLRNRAEGALE